MNSDVHLALYNSLGQSVKRQLVTTAKQGKILLEVEDLENGLYFGRLESEKGSSNLVRMVVLR